jgi:hypothetical protein
MSRLILLHSCKGLLLMKNLPSRRLFCHNARKSPAFAQSASNSIRKSGPELCFSLSFRGLGRHFWG